eukprot:9228801-Pyramimonas_sp.AAC.1
MENWEMANSDLGRVVHQLRVGRRRRAAPLWPMPTEAWCTLFSDRLQRRAGGDRPPVAGPLLQEFPLAQFVGRRLHRRPNARWNFSQ